MPRKPLEKEAIIKALSEQKSDFSVGQIVKILESRGIVTSRQYVSSLLGKAVKGGKFRRTGNTRGASYVHDDGNSLFIDQVTRTLRNEGLDENVVLNNVIGRLREFGSLNDNVKRLVKFAFLEMLNNAIDHSDSVNIKVSLSVAPKKVCFLVTDRGIGVFKNIMSKRGLASPLEAMEDLTKGKTTTAPDAHSGEGIFFVSKMADKFVLESDGYRFVSVNSTEEDVFFERDNRASVKGTSVSFEIENDSSRTTESVFRRFETDPEEHAFDKTKILVKLWKHGRDLLSRSESRRIMSGLDKFKTIILDFRDVDSVGQGFVDEVFRVFPSNHSLSIKIEAINMNEPVAFMVNRAKNTRR